MISHRPFAMRRRLRRQWVPFNDAFARLSNDDRFRARGHYRDLETALRAWRADGIREAAGLQYVRPLDAADDRATPCEWEWQQRRAPAERCRASGSAFHR